METYDKNYDKLDQTKPMKPKIERKDRIRPKTSEKESMVVDQIEKTETTSDIQETPKLEDSAKIKPQKASKKKDSVQVSVPEEKLEQTKPIETIDKPSTAKGKKSIPEPTQKGSSVVAIEDQIESLGKLKIEDDKDMKNEQLETKVEPNNAALEAVQTSEETAIPSKIDRHPGKKDRSSVKKKPHPAKAVDSKQDEESSPFGGFKLKKAETVKRQVEQDAMESVKLKHHELEMQPMEEQVFVFLEKLIFILVIIFFKI